MATASVTPAIGKNGVAWNWRTSSPARATEIGKVPKLASMSKLMIRPSACAGAHCWTSVTMTMLPNPLHTPEMASAAAAPGKPPRNGSRQMATASIR